jgi:hypothetical protein
MKNRGVFFRAFSAEACQETGLGCIEFIIIIVLSTRAYQQPSLSVPVGRRRRHTALALKMRRRGPDKVPARGPRAAEGRGGGTTWGLQLQACCVTASCCRVSRRLPPRTPASATQPETTSATSSFPPTTPALTRTRTRMPSRCKRERRASALLSRYGLVAWLLCNYSTPLRNYQCQY